MAPSVLAKALSRPSSSIFLRNSRSLVASGVAKVALVASPLRPLPLLTMSSPMPPSQVSKYHRSVFIANGLGAMPAALIFSAAWDTSSRVCGGWAGSSPAFTKWALLKYSTGVDTFMYPG
jgi:hypothetical protein